MGANIFNMGLITSAIGYGLYAISRNRNRKIKADLPDIHLKDIGKKKGGASAQEVAKSYNFV